MNIGSNIPANMVVACSINVPLLELWYWDVKLLVGKREIFKK
jgi:hypothetical protein